MLIPGRVVLTTNRSRYYPIDYPEGVSPCLTQGRFYALDLAAWKTMPSLEGNLRQQKNIYNYTYVMRKCADDIDVRLISITHKCHRVVFLSCLSSLRKDSL